MVCQVVASFFLFVFHKTLLCVAFFVQENNTLARSIAPGGHEAPWRTQPGRLVVGGRGLHVADGLVLIMCLPRSHFFCRCGGVCEWFHSCISMFSILLKLNTPYREDVHFV